MQTYSETAIIKFCTRCRLKILVTGASGLLGRAVLAELHRDRHFETVGIAHSRAKGNLSRVDLLCKQEVDSFFEKTRPDCVIHCAAIRDPDVCIEKPELTNRLNVDSTRWLAEAALQ
ncbi:MAG: NAD-dependent epimerase/dehydratase family protein [Flavobacteriales bacterium]